MFFKNDVNIYPNFTKFDIGVIYKLEDNFIILI